MYYHESSFPFQAQIYIFNIAESHDVAKFNIKKRRKKKLKDFNVTKEIGGKFGSEINKCSPLLLKIKLAILN